MLRTTVCEFLHLVFAEAGVAGDGGDVEFAVLKHGQCRLMASSVVALPPKKSGSDPVF